MTRAPGDWDRWLDQRLDTIREEGRWRRFRAFDAWGPHGTLDGQPGPVTSFASNDYLGLTVHPQVVAAGHAALDRWGSGSGGARLITGARPVHDELERELAAWKGTDRAVLFPTGFAANLGTLTSLGAAGVRIVSDICWCSISEPVFPPQTRTLITNSGKYAHYGPGLSGRAVRFGSLRDCVSAALTGHAPDLPDWLKG